MWCGVCETDCLDVKFTVVLRDWLTVLYCFDVTRLADCVVCVCETKCLDVRLTVVFTIAGLADCVVLS